MAMTKEDYKVMGSVHAKMATGGAGGPARYKRSDASWQAVAYWEGWDSPRMHRKLTARQEHIRVLEREIRCGWIMTTTRLLRISHKIEVLKGREAMCGST